jgi:hypothetical protein
MDVETVDFQICSPQHEDKFSINVAAQVDFELENSFRVELGYEACSLACSIDGEWVAIAG